MQRASASICIALHRSFARLRARLGSDASALSVYRLGRGGHRAGDDSGFNTGLARTAGAI